MKRHVALVASVLSVAAAAGEQAWHCHSLGKPKVLYLAGSPNSEMFAEQLRHVVPADVAFAPLRYGDLEMHHLCDKPLEESKEDQAYVLKEGAAYFDGLVARMREFQVVIAQLPVRSNDKAESDRLAATQKALADYARAGGKLVVINPGWEAAYEGTPLADVLPVKSGKGKSWVYSCGPATDHPLGRGIPLEVTGAHFYGPIYEPADESCSALTDNGKLTGFWHRRLPGGGEVVHLFQVGGERYQWRGENAATYDPARPDDGAAWNTFYRRLLYGLAHGDRAFPVLVRVATKPCRAGEALTATVAIENRSGAEREVTVILEVRHRRSPTTVREARKLALAKGQSTQAAFAPKVELPCTDSWLLVTAQALDADGKTILSDSTTWVPYRHRVPLSVRTDKVSYRPGETITATATWPPDAEEGGYLAVAYVVDRSGRALKRAPFEVTGERTATAKLVMPDRGPEFLGSYWVTGVFSKQGQIAGLARAQVQLDQPWTMRERFEWSVWTWGGGGRLIDLMRDAGFNALGCTGNPYTADRYGMRQYVEGTGIDTFSVEINHHNWEAVRTAMHKTIERLNQGGPDARSKSLVSLGEESGFKGGWGTRYYWPEDKAPAIPQKVFDDYLRERYAGNIALLNQEWGTNFASFDEIPLEKAKVKSPGQVFVSAQAWEAMQKKGETKPVIPVDLARLDPSTSLGAGPKQKYIGPSAPYWETYNFFDWYYQKYCDLATEVYRTRRNPVPLTIISAPGGFYPKVDVYNFGGQGPFYPKEAALVGNAIARRDYGDVPGFSAAMWAYFDLRSLWNCTVMSSILAGNTHIDYWVDVPLTFNADLTHTRASFWTKELRERLRPIEPILLHKRFAYTDGLGMLVGQQPLPKGILGQHFGSAIDCNAPIYSALEETGYMPKVVHAKDLKDIRVLVASHAQVLSAEQGKAVCDFVKGGGLLISTPWLASCSPHGNALTVYPAEETGLAELLGFRLLNTSQAVVKEDATVPNLPKVWNLREVTLMSKGKDKVLDIAPDVEVLARHKDAEFIPQAKLLLALATWRVGDRDEAVKLLREIVRSHPNDPAAPRAQFLMGYLFFAAGEQEPAHAAFLRVINDYPDSPFAEKAIEFLGTEAANRAEAEAERLQAEKLPSTTCLRTKQPIRIDGRLDDAAWNTAPVVRPVHKGKGDEPAPQPEPNAAFRLLWDDSTLYIAFECRDDDIHSEARKRDDPVLLGDAMRVLIAPVAVQAQDQLTCYFDFAVAPTGAVNDGKVVFERGTVLWQHARNATAWNCLGVQCSARADGTFNDAKPDRGWRAELAIPLDALGFRPSEGSVWRMSFLRVNWQADGERVVASWSPLGAWLPQPRLFGQVTFRAAAER